MKPEQNFDSMNIGRYAKIFLLFVIFILACVFAQVWSIGSLRAQDQEVYQKDLSHLKTLQVAQDDDKAE